MCTIKLFETKQVLSICEAARELWFFKHCCRVVTDIHKPRTYWSVLKTRLKKECSELTTNCNQLKLKEADGKSYPADESAKVWCGLATRQNKQVKGLKRGNLHDHMTKLELVLNILAKVTISEISRYKLPADFETNRVTAQHVLLSPSLHLYPSHLAICLYV